MNSRLERLVMLGVAGVTAMETKVAGVTVNKVEPEMLPTVAVIVAVPCPALLARPFVPAALLMVATVVSEELQVAAWARGCVEPSV